MGSLNRLARLIAWPLLAAAAAGCVTDGSERQRIDETSAFIVVGQSSRSDVVARFGDPTVAFENGRLAIYIFDVGEDTREAGPDHPANILTTHLVIEYDDAGVVLRHRALSPP